MKVICLALICLASGTTVRAAAPPLGICVPCTVVKVHDGDTATDVVIHLHVQVRYRNCWAPEANAPGGAAATASAKQAEGKTGRLFIPVTGGSLSDLFTFGRVLGEIWLDGAQESESQRQVRLQHASTAKGGELGR